MTAGPELDILLGSNDLARSVRFYNAVMAVLGVGRAPDWPEGWAGWGPAFGEGVGIWICPPYDGRPATAGNGIMLSMRAPTAAAVRAFHAAALAQGGSDEGAPGTRARYSPDFYVAYVRDPDGNKLACACHTYRPEEDDP